MEVCVHACVGVYVSVCVHACVHGGAWVQAHVNILGRR